MVEHKVALLHHVRTDEELEASLNTYSAEGWDFKTTFFFNGDVKLLLTRSVEPRVDVGMLLGESTDEDEAVR